jgi:hypothetical protein
MCLRQSNPHLGARTAFLLIIVLMLSGLGHTIAGGNADDVRQVLLRAIKAHGGKERLVAIRSYHTRTTGSTFRQGMVVEFVAEKWEELPSRMKVTAVVTDGQAKEAEIRVTNGEKTWRKIDDQQAELLADAFHALVQEGLYTRYLMTLVPLLEDKTLSISMIGESILAKRAVVGLRVVAKEKQETEFFFDKETWLLSRRVTKGAGPTRDEPPVDEYFYEYKDFGGLKYPTRAEAFSGKDKVQERITKSIEPAKLEPAMFMKP